MPKPKTAKLRQDVRYLMPGSMEQAGFVTNTEDEDGTRPTLFVSAMCRSAADRRWFERVLDAFKGLEVPA